MFNLKLATGHSRHLPSSKSLLFSISSKRLNANYDKIITETQNDDKKSIESAHSISFTNFLSDNMKIVAIPINSSQFYLQYIEDKQLVQFEHKAITLEKKVTTKALTYWQKMKDSQKSYAKFTVKTIENLLEKLPWSEKSFASIPSEQFIIKRLKATELAKVAFPDKEYITFFEYLDLINKNPELKSKLNNDSIIKPTKIYMPKIPGFEASEEVISKKIYEMASFQASYYSRQMWKCIAAFPLTFPFVIIPFVPNIPGFYICFRLYWNFKAFAGAKHVMEMYHKNQGSSFQLEYVPEFSEDFEKVFDLESKSLLLKNDQQMDAFEKLVQKMELDPVKANVVKAVMQENYK
ncbi:hypothetical protein QEN19_003036 [Hanseniaspora menglaensis]